MRVVTATYATSRVEEWSELAEALGMRLERTADSVQCVGDGTLILQRVGRGAPEHGSTRFEVLDDEPTASHAAGGLSLMPLWVTPDVTAADSEVRALGVRPRLGSDSGVWRDYVADAGLLALHEGEPERIELSFEHDGDLDALAELLRAHGHGASVVDEAYNRTLLVATPDGWTLWINGAQGDLYGFHRAG